MCQFKWICAKCVPLKIDRKKQKKGAGKPGGDPTMEPTAACIVANLP
jgi:hypothetical protein